MALVAIFYPVMKKISRWDQTDLVNFFLSGNILYKKLHRQIFLTAELPQNV